jgi:hypothetical protein
LCFCCFDHCWVCFSGSGRLDFVFQFFFFDWGFGFFLLIGVKSMGLVRPWWGKKA